MGQAISQQDRLFDEFNLDERVPSDHSLRPINVALALSWLRDERSEEQICYPNNRFKLQAFAGAVSRRKTAGPHRRRPRLPDAGDPLAIAGPDTTPPIGGRRPE